MKENEAVQRAINNKPGGVGRSCGCDRSEEMAVELGAFEGSVALARIEETLRTIGEREDVGYITEAMVQHRLHLLALGQPLATLQRAMPSRHPLPP